MASKSTIRETCSKRGLVLTCYVDGKKRFKAALLSEQASSEHLNATASTGKYTQVTSRRTF